MSQDEMEVEQKRCDFFISYTGSDQQWAEWIAFMLEEAGYQTVIQAWDSRPGSNFVAMMNEATKQDGRTIAVLSAAYLQSEFGFAEWAAAFRRDPTGKQGQLVPVRIEACEVQGLLGPVVYLDLVGLGEAQAKEQLLAGVKQGRAKPLYTDFPGGLLPPQSGSLLLEHPVFPGTKTNMIENKGPVQGQIIGDRNAITIHFHDSIESPMPAQPTPPKRIWNIPYPRNPFFTGRDAQLKQLYTQLRTERAAAVSQPHAISGLGGIGKTQLVIEYAYRYAQEYHTVLWAKADTKEELQTWYTEIINLLHLSVLEASGPEMIVQTVKGWLSSNSNWLLILDNADELDLVQTFLPTRFAGHLLLTTRAQIVGKLARRLEVDTLDREMGALLLLRRAGVIEQDRELDSASPSDRAIAMALTEELGGLPLALDQAGAYIEETQCSLVDYQQQYQIRRADLLARRGKWKDDHPEPVTMTWSLSFTKVEQASSTAAELLQACAFLASNAIPEELLIEVLKIPLVSIETPNKRRRQEGQLPSRQQKNQKFAPVVKTRGEIHEALAVLRSYSLIERYTGDGTLQVHRLVQATLRNTLSVRRQQQWMQRIIIAVIVIFDHNKWDNTEFLKCLLPHALLCTTWIGQEVTASPEGARLLNRTGDFLQAHGRFPEAEPLLESALTIFEQQLGADHLDTATSLSSLGKLYQESGRHREAESLLQRALTIRELLLGIEHPNTVITRNNLMEVYISQGKYSEMKPVLEQALMICEHQSGANSLDTVNSVLNLSFLYEEQKWHGKQQLGTDSLDAATSMLNRANVYEEQEEYTKAEPLYEGTLAVYIKVYGSEHPYIVLSLTKLAKCYESQGKDEQAEPLLRRALAIREQQLGFEHPDITVNRDDLAQCYKKQKKYEQAEMLYLRTLEINTRVFGVNHLYIVPSLTKLAKCYEYQGKYEQTKWLYLQALAIFEQQWRAKHLFRIYNQNGGDSYVSTLANLTNLSSLYESQGKYEQAESLYQRTLEFSTNMYGPNDSYLMPNLIQLAKCYESQGKHEQAEPLLQQAQKIRKQQGKPAHLDMADILIKEASLYDGQGTYRAYKKAERLLVCALSIREQQFGSGHPQVATSLTYLASFYKSQGKDEQAEPLFKRALEIREAQLGVNHIDTMISLDTLAEFYSDRGQYSKALPLYHKTLVIREQRLGSNHTDVVDNMNSLALNYFWQGQYHEAIPIYNRALEIEKQVLGSNHPSVAISLNNLAKAYYAQGLYAEALPLYQQALETYKRTRGTEHALFAQFLNNLAELCQAQKQYGVALSLVHLARAIRERLLSPSRKQEAGSLNILARISFTFGQYEQARLLFEKVLKISEEVYNPDHPQVATTLNDLAELYKNQGQYKETEPLYQRALTICERTLGLLHPTTQTIQANYIDLLEKMKGKENAKV